MRLKDIKSPKRNWRYRPRRHEELIMYVVSKMPNVSIEKLQGIVYYIDMFAFGVYGEPISGDKYRKGNSIPEGDNFDDAMQRLTKKGYLEVRSISVFEKLRMWFSKWRIM